MSNDPDHRTLRVGLIGAGQIARVQHFPALAATDGLALAAIANPLPVEVPDGVSLHASLPEMLAESPEIDAVAICTPPQVRYALAALALEAGKHVLLEKPPAATPAEVEDLEARARARGVTLFTAWHSMFSAAVEPARAILAARPPRAMRITWKEDVHKFHPGVDWFWQPGGMGVFDPGVNAFSIMLGVMPEPVFVRAATLRIPPGAHTPVAAELTLATPSHADGFSCTLDWNHKAEESWDIVWTLRDGGTLAMARGGAVLTLDDQGVVDGRDEEYPRLYAHFRDLIHTGRSDVDIRPFQLVADAFMVGSREPAAPL